MPYLWSNKLGVHKKNDKLLRNGNKLAKQLLTFEQYIPVVFINNHTYNCIRGYLTQIVVISQWVFITL
jgi:hypothetical protein